MYKKPLKSGLYARRRKQVTADQFRDARVFSGFDRHAAADFLGVSVRTIGHWETGRSRPSYAAFRLLRVYRHGDLIDPAWGDWKLVRGRLYTPEGHAIEAHDAAWLSLLVRRARAFSELVRERDRRGGVLASVSERAGAATAHAGRAVDLPSQSARVAQGQGACVSWGAVALQRRAAIDFTYRIEGFSPVSTGEKGRVGIGGGYGGFGPGSNTGQKGVQA